LKGIIRPATGLQICKLWIALTSLRSSKGGRATIGSSRVSCGKVPVPAPARLAVEADHPSFEAGFQSAGHLDALDAVAACLEFEQVGADDLNALAPVAAYAHRSAVVFGGVSRYPFPRGREASPFNP
jgi:hypothetical protein